jgi:hypothetical protein
MTPEERLTRIERAVQAIVETQTRHEAHLEKHSGILDKHTATLGEHTATLDKHTAILDKHTAILHKHTTMLEGHSLQLEKQSAAIRDLIVISRTLVDAQQKTDNTIQILIMSVDRLGGAVNTLVKSFQKPNGIQ